MCLRKCTPLLLLLLLLTMTSQTIHPIRRPSLPKCAAESGAVHGHKSSTARLTVFFIFLPPVASIVVPYPLADTLQMGGLDGYALQMLIEWRHLPAPQLYTNTDVRSLYELYYDYRRFGAIRDGHRRMYTGNFIVGYNSSAKSRQFDLLLTAFYMRHSVPGKQSKYEYLDPHDFDCLVVLVPNARQRSVVMRILCDGQAQAIVLAVMVFLAVRHVLLGAYRAGDLASMWLHTIGICLAQLPMPNSWRSRRADVWWGAGLVLYSTIAMAAMSAIIYTKLMTDELDDRMRTLDELGRSDLTVYVADLFLDINDWFENLRPTITRNFVNTSLNDVSLRALNRFNASEAFVVQKSVLSAVQILLASQRDLDADDTYYYAISEPLHCGLIAYQVAANSSLRTDFNVLQHRLLEHGLKQINSVRVHEFTRSLNPPLVQSTNTDGRRVLAMQQLLGVFQAYALGMAAGFAFLLAELIWQQLRNLNTWLKRLHNR